MHATYLSLAALAVAVAAIPEVPIPSGNPFEGSYPFIAPGSSAVEDGDGFTPAYEAAMQAIEIVHAASYSKSVSANMAASRPTSSSSKATPIKPIDQQAESTGASQHKSPSGGSSMATPIPTAGDEHMEVYEYSSSMSAVVSYPSYPSSMASSASEVPATSESWPKDMDSTTTSSPTMTQHGMPTYGSLKPSSFITVATTSAHASMQASSNIHEGHMASASAASSARGAASSSSASLSPTSVASDATNMLGKIPVVGSLFSSLGFRA
ncbi:hypothetical protein PDE_07267 [Penicillium oxalicum 114-2]|uniref:Uncharacterized protein n=1 Tax=Penicillium oxalicum (strain 114-2 / CGMCC 5302) TaxID=933388 RepID=S8BBQ8_PENO1|nr:hypothetical protein PDE_07267 [Penicillium oxalicum 114-2]